MSGGTVNITKHMKRQGIDPHMIYEAHVTDNNDPRKLCRIRARIDGIFDGIADSDLPWCVAEYEHPDGAYNPGGDAVDRSGMAMIPKKKHKVGVKFPTGDPHRPVWTNYTVDEQTALPENQDVNYPDRAVFKFANGSYIILDTRTNELILNNPGDIDMTVLGDVNQYVIGNQQLTVSSRKGDIAGYLLNAPETVLDRLGQRPAKKIPFKGLLSKSYSGNMHTYVTGDQTCLIEGNRSVVIKGNDFLRVHKNRFEKITMLHRVEATRSETNG